jgi:sensor histidine kinase YesM
MPLKYHWFFKYKLHHLPFWFGYHFLWWTLRIGSPIAVIGMLGVPHAATKFIFYLVFQMAGVYFNHYVLIPRFLEKGRYVSYVLLLLLTIILTAGFVVLGYYAWTPFSDKTFAEVYGPIPPSLFSLYEGGALPSTAAAMTLAMSIKLTRSWIQARRRARELETEKLETELKFLKSQFNPHFLFNTINSIFVLIHKDPRVASESLAKFSDLLRYQLYECNEHQISLSQELTYLHNFIELEKLRQNANTEWTFEVDEVKHANLAIAPFILMPFIENAFKHLSQHRDKKNWIKMLISVDEYTLNFSVSNSSSPHHHTANGVKPYNGIGLQNVRRRLELVYPETHALRIIETKDEFQVLLQLRLSEQSMPHREIQLA